MQLQHGCEGGGGGMLRDAFAPPLTHIFHYRISVQLSRCLAVTGQSSLRAVVDATCTSLGDRFCGLQKERKT